MNELIRQLKQRFNELNINDTESLHLIDAINNQLVRAKKIEECLYDSDLYLVYKHTDPDGKIYIGITQNHPQTRWHEGGGYEKQSKFYKAIQKYGWINFKHEIIDAGLSKEEALKLENELILLYKSYDKEYGYNTMVDLDVPIAQKEALHKIKNSSKKNDIFTVAQNLVDRYSIKTINNQIFYLLDNQYIPEADNPILGKMLITEYKIPTKDHKEVFAQIRIISNKTIKELSKAEQNAFLINDDGKVLSWIKNNHLLIDYFLSTPTDSIFKQYSAWCISRKFKNILGKKKFYEKIEQKYGLFKKQKSDGKRYFVKER